VGLHRRRSVADEGQAGGPGNGRSGHAIGLALVPAWWRPSATTVRVVPLADPPWTHRIEALVLRPHAAGWTPLLEAVSDGGAGVSGPGG
jgi:hypothetical protein